MLRSLLSSWLLIVQVLGQVTRRTMLGVKHCLRKLYITLSATQWIRRSLPLPPIIRDLLPLLALLGVARRQGTCLGRLTHLPKVQTSAPSQTRPRARQDMLLNRRRLFHWAHMFYPFQALREADPLDMATPLSPLNRFPRQPTLPLIRRLASGSWKTCMLRRRTTTRRARPPPHRRRRRPVPIVTRPSRAHRTWHWQFSGHRGNTQGPLPYARRARPGQQPYRLPHADRY